MSLNQERPAAFEHESKGLVSVIIPTFNRSRCIHNSISSVLSQTYSDIEILVVDDGSSDDTASVVQSLHDSRVHFFPLSHQGACAARNYGMSKARGSFLAFHDSDDLWSPRKIARQLELLESTGADICFCRMHSRTTYGRKHSWYVPRWRFTQNDVACESLLAQNYISTQTILGRREAVLSEEFDTAFPRLQDWDYVLRLIQRWSFGFVEEVLVEQRVGRDSISANAERRAVALEMLLDKHKRLYEEYPKSKATALMSLGKTCLRFDASKARNAFSESWMIGHDPRCLAGICASSIKEILQ